MNRDGPSEDQVLELILFMLAVWSFGVTVAPSRQHNVCPAETRCGSLVVVQVRWMFEGFLTGEFFVDCNILRAPVYPNN